MAEIHLDFFYPHPRARVWRALTESSLLASWLMENDFVPRAGHEFRLAPAGLDGLDGLVTADVIEVVAEHRLDMVWRTDDMHLGMSWQLEAVPGGTVLQLIQTGYLGLQGTNRRRALLRTYDRTFGRRLPTVLSTLAERPDQGGPGWH